MQAVEGHRVIAKAIYKGNSDDSELVAYWCITTQDAHQCVSPVDTGSYYKVTIDGCPPNNFGCCYFTVSFKIESPTLKMTGANLTSAAGWELHFNHNSTLGMNVILGCFIIVIS